METLSATKSDVIAHLDVRVEQFRTSVAPLQSVDIKLLGFYRQINKKLLGILANLFQILNLNILGLNLVFKLLNNFLQLILSFGEYLYLFVLK